MKALVCLLVFCVFCMANVRQETADAIKTVAQKSGIDERVYYTIISVESNFEPYSIGLIGGKELTKKLENLKDYFSIKKSVLGNKYLVSMSTNSKENIIKLAKALYAMNINIDLGLMQVSKQHVNADELEIMFDASYNLSKATKILFDCTKRFQIADKAIECYNKGFNIGKNRQYYQLFAKSWNKNFGESE